MSTVPEAAAPRRDTADQSGLLRALRSDYLEHCRAKREPPGRSRALLVPRMLTNPSLRACVLFRLCATSSRWWHWLWRSILVHRYACDVAAGVRIGPGLRLPHPLGIVISPSVTIGRRVLISHLVSIGGDGRSSRGPVIGDDVILLPAAFVFGDVHVGAGATVRAKGTVLDDVPAQAVHRSIDGLSAGRPTPPAGPGDSARG